MFDMFKMLGKINEVKAEAEKVKEELKDIEIHETDSKEWVQVVATADKNIRSISIDESVLFPEKKEEVDAAVLEATQNALKAAADKAKALIKERINDKYPEIAGMGLDKWLG
jgi:DNA-binding protein YbaB